MSDHEVYDTIVVGAGSAGCVLAGRLSEDPDRRVVVVEAGPPATGRLFEVPALFPRQRRSTGTSRASPNPGCGGAATTSRAAEWSAAPVR